MNVQSGADYKPDKNSCDVNFWGYTSGQLRSFTSVSLEIFQAQAAHCSTLLEDVQSNLGHDYTSAWYDKGNILRQCNEN